MHFQSAALALVLHFNSFTVIILATYIGSMTISAVAMDIFQWNQLSDYLLPYNNACKSTSLIYKLIKRSITEGAQ